MSSSLCCEPRRPHGPWREPPDNPFAKRPIHCFCCGAVVVEDEKSLGMYVIRYPGIACPECGVIVIPVARYWC